MYSVLRTPSLSRIRCAANPQYIYVEKEPKLKTNPTATLRILVITTPSTGVRGDRPHYCDHGHCKMEPGLMDPSILIWLVVWHVNILAAVTFYEPHRCNRSIQHNKGKSITHPWNGPPHTYAYCRMRNGSPATHTYIYICTYQVREGLGLTRSFIHTSLRCIDIYLYTE